MKKTNFINSIEDLSLGLNKFKNLENIFLKVANLMNKTLKKIKLFFAVMVDLLLMLPTR